MKLSDNQIKTLKAANRILEKMATYNTEVSFTSANMAKDFFRTKLSHLDNEVFEVAFLNTQHGLIASETMFLGTVNQAPVYPREVVKRALEHNAAAIILSHNHPSGTTEPSHADRNITAEIEKACTVLDVKVLDHIIVAKGNTYSFAEKGLL